MPAPVTSTPRISQAIRDLARRYLKSGSHLDMVASHIALNTPGLDIEVARLVAAALDGADPSAAAANLFQASHALRQS